MDVWPVLFVVGCTLQPHAPTHATRSADHLAASVHVPSRVELHPIELGTDTQDVVVTVRNEGFESATIGAVRIAYRARRNGAEIPCDDIVGFRARERRTIEPGAHATYIRTISCSMPLPGRYDVAVSIAWNGVSLHEVGRFALDVVDPSGCGPKPVGGRPGLAAAFSGARLAEPTRAWPAVIAIVNASPHAEPIGSMRVVLRSRRAGQSIWCTDPATDVPAPETLAAGGMLVSRTSLRCDLTDPGIHVIDATLVLAGSSMPTELGEVRVRITSGSLALNGLTVP